MSSNFHNHNNNDAVFEIKNRLDLIDVISGHVVLKKTGRNYWGLCPFHKEKSPSFSVNPDKGIYKCFGCGEGGDAISFLMKINNESFFEVISDLAQKFNIELPATGKSSEKTEFRHLIYEYNMEATKFYNDKLMNSHEGAKAKEYLINRGISPDIIEKFQLGYSMKQSDALINHLMAKFKPSFDQLEKAGLVSKKSVGNGYCDRFRHRLMVPVKDEKGNIIAFGARALDEGQNPKYLNSPDTLVFSKSRTLFALYQAKEEIKRVDSVLIMEGYFDVISAHANGLTNVVATSGTALTEQHLKLLAKYTHSRRIYLAFDGDDAGINATNRGAEVIKSVFMGLGDIKQFDENFVSSSEQDDRSSCEIRVVTTTTGKDPDEFIRNEGIDSYRNLINEAPLLIDYQISRIIKSKGELTTPQSKANVVKELIPILSEIKNSIIRDEYIDVVSKKLGVNCESLAIEVKNSLQKINIIPQKSTKLPALKKPEKHVLAQKNLLSLYFLDSEKLPISCINKYLQGINFTELDYLIIKEQIDSMVDSVFSSKELIERLMIKLVDNESAKQSVVDMMFSLEDKKCLDEKTLRDYIQENIMCVNRYLAHVRQTQLKSEYDAVKDDELMSLQMQYKVREMIELNRHRLETN